jgi:spermidine/putrescine transport system substrate-binding protein
VLARYHLRPAFVLIVLTTIVVAACSGGGGNEPQALTVLEWAGYEAPDFWTDFQTANPDVAVDFQFGTTDADILSKMETSSSSVDVFHFYTGWQKFYVDEGLVQEIDTSKLTNWDKVPVAMQELGQIDGKQYYVPWDWGFSSILYNTEHVPEVTSWDALFNTDYAGHIAMWDDGPAAVTVSSYIHGWDETQITDDQLTQIEQEWFDQFPLNIHYWDSEYENLCPEVQSGDIWVAYAWQGCYASSLYGPLDADGNPQPDLAPPVAYANPVEGRNSWVGLYGISADSDSPELALKFIDDKLAALSCGNAVTLFYYGCANQEVMDGVTDPVLIEAFSLNDPSILETTNFTPLVTQEQRDAWTAMWERVKAQ